MQTVLSIDNFLNQADDASQVILDARSPAEYARAHIPGAICFPLLNNEERILIGTIFKQEGREAAVIKGFEMVGPKFAGFIIQARELAPNKEVFIYCWRGGLRSNIMAWILTTGGFKVTLLKGGYKTFRHWVLGQFNIRKNLMIIGGKTGSGKTALLHELEKKGEQIIDLEALANHKGSAFGSLGKTEQPTTEHFENLLAVHWHSKESTKIIWMENESFKIGTCALPVGLFEQLRQSPVIEIHINYELRKQRILSEYGRFDKQLLSEKTCKIKKRLGGLRLKNALHYIEQGELGDWCDIMLQYYDKTYAHSDALREKNKTQQFFFNTDNMKENATTILKQFYDSQRSMNHPNLQI